MKKRHFAWGAALLMAASLSFQSCDFLSKVKTGEGADSLDVEDSLVFCTVMYEDTLTVGQSNLSQSMRADFPTPEATGVLADSLRAFLAAEIAQNCWPNVGEGEKMPKQFTYELGKEQEYLGAYAGEGMTLMVSDAQEAAEEGFMAPGFENEYNASVVLQTPAYVTYDISHSIYTGGAHGLWLSRSVTFRRSDGHRMGWDLFDMSKKAEIVEAIKLSLRSYFAFEPENDPIPEQELMDQLQLWDDPDTPENELEYGIPLPRTAPCVTREGIGYVYQQYEIAAYACGLPSGILPFDTVRDLLSDEGRELLGME